MATWWRRVVPVGLLVAPWISCSSEHAKRTAADAGPSAAGEGNADGSVSGGIAAEAGAAGAENDATVNGGPGAGGTWVVTPGVPAEWTCNTFAYGDGTCDCGCGAPDADCSELDLGSCEVCNGAGSCNLAQCPGRIDPDDVSRCMAPPQGWTCAASAYGDGETCDCGCGILDEDCPDADAASCDRCTSDGSCANGPCPSSLVADDNPHCELPVRWSCDAASYGDSVCNCGCGAVDIDCPDASADSCETCEGGCSPFECVFEPDDNAHCPEPPPSWYCSARLYRDGSRCDCGCGAIDPDCESLGEDACDKCDAPGSCSAQPCPGLIKKDFNADCDQPPPPQGWTCPPSAYADGLECDCGCGAPDLDCRSADVSDCQRCIVCGGHGVCEGTVDPEDTTGCAPPPSEWACSAAAFRDAICDCGCAIPDIFCQGIEEFYVCENYPVEGCTAGNRTHIDPNHNAVCIIDVPSDWACDRSYYDDGVCDCGCGALDLDCVSNDVSTCEACDDAGSCSSAACPGTIVSDDTAHCSN